MLAIQRSASARALVAAFLCSATTAGLTSLQVAHASSTTTVTVNATSVVHTIPQAAFGANTAAWDSDLMDGVLPGLLRSAGLTVLRFPGGSSSDNYHWQTNTQSDGGYTNPNNTFDNFMNVAQQSGAQPVITVNYGSNSTHTAGGDPTEAAAWVRYANITKHYGVKYWEVGNEVYGNGTYGANWETDLHTQKGPAAYATNALTYISDMKAVDPSIKVGLVLTAPGNWPDGQSPDWDSTILSTPTVCTQMDFAIIHWYAQNPGSESDSGLLASTAGIPNMISTLRSRLTQYCGSTRASQIEILVTETNSVASGPGKQSVSLVNALFLADNYMSLLEQGVSNVDWWDLHNSITTGTNVSPSLYGTANYGDYGLFSFGGSSGGISEPPNETPFPAYYGLQMLTHLGVPGDQMVNASSSQSLIAVHAVKQANGDLALLLINRDPANSYPVSISLNGYTPSATATSYSYGENSTAITSGQLGNVGSTVTDTVAPYSLTTLVFTPGSSVGTAPSSATDTPVAPTSTSTATQIPVAPGSTDTPVPTATTSAPQATNTPVAPAATNTPSAPVMSFTTEATVAPAGISASVARSAGIQAGSTALIQAVLSNTGSNMTGGVVDLELFNSAGQQVGQQAFSGQSLTAGQSVTYNWQWPVPSQADSYELKLGVFGAGWSPLYYWNNQVTTITVAAAQAAPISTSTSVPATSTNTPVATSTPRPVSTATNTPVATATKTVAPAPSPVAAASLNAVVSAPTTLTVAASGTIRVQVTSRSAKLTGIVDIEVYNSANQQVGQQYFSGQTLVSNRPVTYSWLWKAPSQAGTYQVKVGMFGAGWSPMYYWSNQAATITVVAATSSSTPPPATPTQVATTMSFSIQPASTSLSVSRGATTTIKATVTNTGSALNNGTVALEIDTTAGTQVALKQFTGQNIAAGQSLSLSWQWTAPTQAGTYRMQARVLGSTGQQYYGNNQLITAIVH